jgi:hypothetical protein
LPPKGGGARFGIREKLLPQKKPTYTTISLAQRGWGGNIKIRIKFLMFKKKTAPVTLPAIACPFPCFATKAVLAKSWEGLRDCPYLLKRGGWG